MEPLIELPKNRWPQLRDLYRANWPEGVTASCILQTHICCPALTDAFGFKVYCADGDINNGMIAWTDSKKEHFELMIHPFRNKHDVTENALLKTKCIDWSRSILSSANSQVLSILEKVKIDKGLQFCINTKTLKHLLKRQSNKFENLSCPPNTYVGPLKPEHIPLVDVSWEFHSKISHQYFEIMMQHDLFYVLYTSGNKPLAWIAVNPEGTLTHLYCLEEYRRKGYAEFMTKIATNDLLARDRDVLAYTIEGNEKPRSLFAKLGFEVVGQDFWVLMKKIC